MDFPRLRAPGGIKDLGWLPGIGLWEKQRYVMEWSAIKDGVQYCMDQSISKEEFDALNDMHYPPRLVADSLIRKVNGLWDEGKLFLENS